MLSAFLTPTMLLGLGAVFLAGVTSGLTGFGFALVTVPVLVIVLPPKVVVPIISLLSNLTHAIIMVETWRWLQPRRIWPLMVTGVIGIPLGTYLLLALAPQTLKIMIGAVTALAAIAMLIGFTRPVRNEKLAFFPIGFISGLLTGSTAMGGPPVVLFFSNQGVDKQVCRANFTLFFTITSLVAIPSQLAGGLLTSQVWTYALAFSPALLLGTFVGIRLARIMTDKAFRKLTLFIIIATGLSAVASGLGVL